MTTLPHHRNKPSYPQVLKAVEALSVAERLKLRDQLTNLLNVQFMRPTNSERAIRRGRRLAKTVRSELNKANDSLEETMTQLRGRSSLYSN